MEVKRIEMDIKDRLSGGNFQYIGRALTRADKSGYQFIYRNEKLESLDADVALSVDITDNVCNGVYYRIRSEQIQNHYIAFWNNFITTPVSILNVTPLNLEPTPIDALSADTIVKAIELELQLFYAVADSYIKDSSKYSLDTYDLPLFSVARMSVMLTDKTPLDWFTLPVGAELKRDVAELVRCKELLQKQNKEDLCTTLENAMQMKQARINVLKDYFEGNSIQEYMDSASKFFYSQAFRRMYIPMMRKFFKDEVFFSESYVDYSKDIA